MNPVVQSVNRGSDLEASMFECGTTDGGWNQAQHERWLRMKAAYNRYINASIPLNDLTEELGDVQVRILEEQRLAYEAYIEARLQFSESLLPRFGAGPVTRESQKVSPPLRVGLARRRLIPVMVIAFLCLAALGLVYITYDRLQFTDSDEAVGNHARSVASTLRSRASNPVQQFPAQCNGSVPFVPIDAAAPPRVRATTPAQGIGQRWSRPRMSVPKKKTATRSTQPVKLRRSGKHAYYEFTIKLVPQFGHLEPIDASLRLVDWKHNNSDLSLPHDYFRIERQLSPYEPRWFRFGARGKPVPLRTGGVGKEPTPGPGRRADAGYKWRQFSRF